MRIARWVYLFIAHFLENEGSALSQETFGERLARLTLTRYSKSGVVLK